MSLLKETSVSFHLFLTLLMLSRPFPEPSSQNFHFLSFSVVLGAFISLGLFVGWLFWGFLGGITVSVLFFLQYPP